MAFLSFLSPIFGSKPKIADYHPVDLSAEQLKAIEADLAAWPQIQQLGNMFQQYLLGQYETAIPGFSDILKAGGATTQEMLKQSQPLLEGKIPEDVKNALYRSTAYESLQSGTAGSGMSHALTARDLGLTSLNLINQGAELAGKAGNAAQRWASLSGAQTPEGMLITPQQQSQLDVQQELIRQATKQTKFNVAAAPDPVAKGLSDIVQSLTAAYLGSLGGGGMGGGKSGGYAGAGAGNYYPTSTPATVPTSGLSKDTGGYSSAYTSPTLDTGYTATGGDATYGAPNYQSQIGENPFNNWNSDIYGGSNFNTDIYGRRI